MRRFGEVELDVGSLDGREGDAHAAGVRVIDGHALIRDLGEHAVELPASLDGLARAYEHPLPARTPEVLRSDQGAIHPGGRAFEVVAPWDGVVGIEEVSQLARHP